MKPAPDVTAVVLSLGETTTARAIASVSQQTLAAKEIVLIEGITPFHRALNEGAARATMPFFVQLDADMVLDSDCIENLTGCLADNVGLVVGQLRDPLYGRVEAVKLFRTECVRRHPFRDSISPDTDFGAEIGRAGWVTLYALRHGGETEPRWHTFGEHDPTYTPLYTYAKHAAEGQRLRYRRAAASMRYQLRRLHESSHAAALTAQIALAHGLFLDGEGDLLSPYAEDRDFLRLVDFLSSRGAAQDRIAIASRVASVPKAAFRRGYKLGIALMGARRADRFEQILVGLHDSRHPCSWLMRIGLCQGLFAERYDSAVFEEEWAKLRVFHHDFRSAGRAWLRRLLGGR